MGSELDMETLESLALPALLALIAFFIRFSIKRERVNVTSFFLDLLAAIFIGVIVAVGIDAYKVPEGLGWGVVALSSMLGPELLAGLFQVAAMFSRSPVTLFVRLIRAVKGDPLDAEEFESMAAWEKEFIDNLEREKRRRK